MKHITLLLLFCILSVPSAWAARASVDNIASDPYRSALVIDADTGKVLFEDQAGEVVYPASVLKLMDLLVILEQLEKGTVKLDDLVPVTTESAKMGGSQVYLDPMEHFSLEDLLYALAVQSANDAAVALAIHVAGSTRSFVQLMNSRADELGMKDTKFHSVHGLPPAKGQMPDQTTARDLAILARELAKRQEIFKYTGTRERPFRQGKFIMRNHNHLLEKVAGCDGFKTGYFGAAGFSIVATAKRDDVRIIAIVMGSKDNKTRDVKAAELLEKGFALMPSRPQSEMVQERPEPVAENNEAQVTPKAELLPSPSEDKQQVPPSVGNWTMFFLGVIAGLLLSGIAIVYISRKRSTSKSNFMRYR